MAPKREEKARLRTRAREAAQRKKKLSLIVGACVLVLAGGLWFAFAFAPSGGGGNGASGGGGSGDGSGGGGGFGVGAAAEVPAIEGVPIADLLEREVTLRLTPAEKVHATIAKHEADIAAEPDSEMNPSRLGAMGNQYKKLRDYEKAADKYELLLADYPGWEGIARIYPNLISCYEQLGKEDEVRRICDEMMERFPADSNEYEWARDRRGMRPLTPEELEAAVGEEETEETP